MPEPMNYQCEYSSSVLRDWKNTEELLQKAVIAYRESCQSVAALASSNDAEAQMLAMHFDHSCKNLYPQMGSQLVHARSNLARARNRTLSPFQSLPSEIIRLIFMDVVHVPASGDRQCPEMIKALETMCSRLTGLMSVCSSWRNIGLNSSELWSFIPVGSYPQTRPSPSTTVSFLQRALASAYNSRPLHLVTSPSPGRMAHLPLMNGNILPRFTSVNIQGSELQIYNFIGAFLTYSTDPALSELSIGQVAYARNRREPHQPRLPSKHLTFGPQDDTFRSLIGSLATLRVCGANLMWDQITFSQNLVELRVQSVVLGHSQSALPNFARVLQSAPELQDLKIIGVAAPPDPESNLPSETPVEIFSLPKLKSLLLEDLDFNVLSFFLGSIAPGPYDVNLFLTFKALQILQEHDYPEEVDFGRVLNLLEESSIDTLLLQGHLDDERMWLEDLDLCELTSSLPILSTLKMMNWKFSRTGLEALLSSGHEDPNLRGECAGLSHLTLSGCLIDPPNLPVLLQAVASHPLQSLEIGPFGVVDTASPAFEFIAQLKTMVPNFREARAPFDIEDFAQHVWQLW